jgi:hypothetical protein
MHRRRDDEQDASKEGRDEVGAQAELAVNRRSAADQPRVRSIRPSASEVQWTSAPDRVRYVPGVIAAVIEPLPDQLFEEDATCWDPPMFAFGCGSGAVSERAVMHDDPADATA